MDREKEYKARADEAQREADRSTNELERQRWLGIVRGWLELLRKRPKSDDADNP
jgi:hypothetical protein